MSDAGAKPPVLKREIGLFGATALGIGYFFGYYRGKVARD